MLVKRLTQDLFKGHSKSCPILMGVLNVTPDSFSDGGRFETFENAVSQARQLRAEGADIIDIGGESTGPGSKPITQDQEWQRIADILRELASEIPLSLDTYHARTASQGIELGVCCINDVSAGRADPLMLASVADSDVSYIMTFAKDAPLPHARDRPTDYGDVVQHLSDFFRSRIDACIAHGIDKKRLMVDPGLGRFVSTEAEPSWLILKDVTRLIEAVKPVPVMIGASRKGFLGGKLDERDPVSQLVSTLAVMQGVRAIRTHNVALARWFLDAAQKMGKIEI